MRSGIAVRVVFLVRVLTIVRSECRILNPAMFVLMRIKLRHANHRAEQRHDANEDGHSAGTHLADDIDIPSCVQQPPAAVRAAGAGLLPVVGRAGS